jgi:hypothetical protein
VRAFNRVLSAFLAGVLIVAGVLTILEICRAALNQPPAVVQWPKLLPKLRNNSYDDVGPILVCVGLAIVGLLLLLSGIKRGKPYALPAGSAAPGVRTEINRRSLQRAMRAAVVATDRVDSGTVLLRRRSVRIVARANTHTIEGLDADIRRRVEALLTSISLVEPPRLKIKAYPAAAPAAPTTPTAPAVTPAPKSAQTPVGVTAGAQPATPAGEQPVPTAPAPVAAPPLAEQARIPAGSRQDQPAPAPKPSPEVKPAPKTEVAEPRAARLDDLLSAPEDDESR